MKAIALVLLVPLSAAIADNNGRGTKAVAMADAFVAVADNSWGISYNPAGLVQCGLFQASAFFVPQQFGLPELRTTAVSASCRIRPGTAGILFEQFGFDLYKTSTVQVGYGIAVGSNIAIGATAEFRHISIERYGAATGSTVDVGCMGWPTPDLALGFALRNATAATIGGQGERLPQSIFFGVSYSPGAGFLAVTEIEKDPLFPLVFKAGFEQTILGFLSLRCGVSNNPDKFSVGFATRVRGVEFGYAGYSHPELGWTHQVELTIRVDGTQ